VFNIFYKQQVLFKCRIFELRRWQIFQESWNGCIWWPGQRNRDICWCV